MKGYIEIKVRGYHLDMFMHVNNARYLEFLEEARWAAFENTKFNPDVFMKNSWSLAVVNININYRRAAGFGAILGIQTSLKKIGTKSVTLEQKISDKDSGDIIVDADVTFVVLDVRSNRAIVINDEIREQWFGE